MKTLSVSAHFDGERIVLDEPLTLEVNTQLIVTVLPSHDAEREAWLDLSQMGLEAAYGDDEDLYSLDDLQQRNPQYLSAAHDKRE